jgi:Ca-activated chloride channel family protein
MRGLAFRSFAWFLWLAPAIASAQGLLIDIRPQHGFRLPRADSRMHHRPRPSTPAPSQSYAIKELAVNVSLNDQIAKVQVSQTFLNTGSSQMEVAFVFPLPYDGAIDQMTFMVDGKEYAAKLLDAKEARRIYEEHLRRQRDPALLEWIGTGMFKTSVFPVPPGAQRKVTMRFSQVCRKSEGLTELIFPLSTARYTSRAVESVTVDVNIQSQVAIKNIYSPTHAVNISRPGDRNARVTFTGQNQTPTTDFRLLYDVGDAAVGASVVSYRPNTSEDGYFMLLVSPEIKRASDQKLKKTVVFVVDRSGSMSGKKIEQAKEALKFVLNNLNEGDLFNIVLYDSEVESFRPELQKYSDETRQQALGFVEGIYAGGSTHIDGALKAALAQLQDAQRPNYVVFLTDGLPTTGETNEAKIVANARDHNKVRARIFSLGVGYDVNSRLLDKLARNGFGQSEYVRPDEDLEAHISKLYNRIGAPALTNLSISIDMEGFSTERGAVANRMYPKDAYDLFAGDQLVVVGRYKAGGAAKVVVSGEVEGAKQSFDFPAKLIDHSTDETYAFVEKLWAIRRVGEIIDQIDLQGPNQELTNELVALATKHGIVTQYTSFLADEQTDFRELAANRRNTEAALQQLEEKAGRWAFEQRAAKARLQYSTTAPAGGFAENLALQKISSDGLNLGGQPGSIVQTVQNVGSKTFFQRHGQWLDSTLTAELEQKVVKLDRGSDEFFNLIARHGKDVAKYLAIEGPVTVVLDGQAYSF